MRIVIPKETYPKEPRIAADPESVKKLKNLGSEVFVEEGLGDHLFIFDEDFRNAGAQVIADRKVLLQQAEILLRVHSSNLEEIALLPKKCIHISFFDPFHMIEETKAFANQDVTAISLEMMPRTTIAQKMDALSSQANLAGYVAVIIAAEKLNRILPMMTTPAGTISPAKVFVIGVGVAGLQAIATARRLGARVEAFDTRPSVEEQVKSLGAKFVKIDIGEIGETKEGYAKTLTEEQLQKQKQEMAKICSRSDIVITTAQLFGKKAPLIIPLSTVRMMKPGSILVDLAVDTGGNIEGSKVGEVVSINGVQIIGLSNLPGEVAFHASHLYSTNLYNLIHHFWNKEEKLLKIDLENDLLRPCIITHDKTIQFRR